MSHEPNIVRRGIFDMQICVPSEYTDEQVIAAAESLNPSGTRCGWNIRKQGHEALCGSDERVDCTKYSGNVHIMLEV